MKNTVYISDLDGTLLTSDAEISAKSDEIINRLISKGMLFTVATARSVSSSKRILSCLDLNLPVVLMNGVFIADIKSGRVIESVPIEKNTALKIIEIFKSFNVSPFMYCAEGDMLDVVFEIIDSKQNEMFYKRREKQYYRRFEQVEKLTPPDNGECVYFNIVDSYSRLKPLADKLRSVKGVSVAFYEDTYLEDSWFLEVFSSKASKCSGMLRIKEMTGAERAVVFGDNLNDISMFECADESFAVSEAVPQLKKIATGVIGSHDEDAVAKHLEKIFEYR